MYKQKTDRHHQTHDKNYKVMILVTSNYIELCTYHHFPHSVYFLVFHCLLLFSDVITYRM
jgi:hypothetical protein